MPMSGAVLRPELGTRAELNTISRGCLTNTESERPADCGFGSGQQQQQVLVFKRSELRSLAASVTVAILAQGTSWAVAVTQAFLLPGSILVGRRWRTVHGTSRVQCVVCVLFKAYLLPLQGGGQQVSNWV